jgi:hypothetical protein
VRLLCEALRVLLEEVVRRLEAALAGHEDR